MKRLLVLVSLLLTSCVSLTKKDTNELVEKVPSETRLMLDSIISLAKENSVYTSQVDWNALEKEMLELYVDNDSLSSMKAPIEHMLTTLGDFHGFAVVNGEQYRGYVKRHRDVPYAFEGKAYAQKMSTIYQRGLKSTNIFTTMIDGSVGYIQIPMILNYSGNDSITIAHTLKIRNQLCALEQQGPKGYIIDLRANIGGSFYPMFAGLGELFPNIHLGGDTKNGKEYYSEWTLQNGNLYNNDYAVPNMPALKCGIELGTRRVAVLVGRFTASSGEALASGLRGQNNIRLIGEQTSGASTTNSFRYISDDVQFNPAVAYYMSKDGTVHTDGIIPDQVIVEEYNMDHVLEGKTITEATKWIQYGDTYVPGKSSMD